ncbi:hypothetical protein CsSME_00028994 [Camellia sinensis var. sinensis]
MGGSKLMKRIGRRRSKENKNGREVIVASFESLPSEVVVEVLGRIASSSFTDFFNAKLSSKILNEAADDNYIYQQMSLEKFPVVPWRVTTEASCFLNKCKESGNPEALYRQGVVDYFSLMRIESGLESLNRAASSGHGGALYVLSIIFLFSEDDEFKKQGIRILSSIHKSKPTSGKRRLIRECRDKLREIVRMIWVVNPLVQKQRPSTCCAIRDNDVDRHERLGRRRRRRGWESDDEDDDDEVECDGCRCDREVDSVCNMFPRA